MTDSSSLRDIPATADVYDEHEELAQVCDIQFRQFGALSSFSGVVSTVDCYRDHAMLETALTTQGSGQVLVVDGHGSLHCALMGDRIAGLAAANGWSGIVINGAIRDSIALRGIPIGIKALGSNPRKSTETGAGSRSVTLFFGGATFTPGDMLYSDMDGIVIISLTK